MKTLNIAIVVLLLPFSLFAQYNWEGGIFGGGGFYLGDLVEDDRIPFFEETQPAFGVYFNYQLHQQWALRINANYLKISGDDTNFTSTAFSEKRQFSFESTILEGGLGFQWEPFGKWRYKELGTFKKLVSPYIFLGLSGLYTDPMADFALQAGEGLAEEVQTDIDEGGTAINIGFPIGGGLKFDLSPITTLGLEVGVRPTLTDYLDGISATAGPDHNDWLLSGGLMLGFRFGTQDADRDGIVDAKDACPRLAGSLSANGCPDRDMDGVEDAEDVCPDIAGPFDLNGCPDRDGDLVIDLIDACPDEPGSEITEGCPDTDNDGIADEKDKCPEIKGFVEMEGCPDTDKDGITDADDECPELEGLKELNGCPNTDRDEDGVIDAWDECPDEKGESDHKGCPVVVASETENATDSIAVAEKATTEKPTETKEIKEIEKVEEAKKDATLVADTEVLPKDVEKLLELATEAVKFETGKSTLKEESLDILGQVASAMQKLENYELKIKGYTDSVGDDEKNKKLSEKRAKACFEHLIFKGVKGTLMSFEGFGEAHPIGDNNTPQGRRQNRRVEFELSKKEQQ